MKKTFPYIIGAVVLGLLVLIMMASRGKPLRQRRMDERITLQRKDKIPYGTRVAQELLPSLFPHAAFPTDDRYPGSWDSIDTYQSNQAVILIADYFDADEEQLNRLGNFVSRGNTVFMIARNYSDAAARYFALSFDTYLIASDSLRVKLEAPAFAVDSVFTYPGFRYAGFIHPFDSIKNKRGYDSIRTAIMGRDEFGHPNFVRMNKGSGSFFIHTAPLAFSNYFILHKNNVAYYQQALSVIPKNVKTVLWNEYFLIRYNNEEEPNWLSTLFKYSAFKWGLLTALFTLALFMLLGMRRKQRMIPPYEKPKNESLDFVKTLGRLYYDKRDHKNLAMKMGAYFLEHVRSTYKMATHTLDSEFVKSLHVKSGYPEPEIKKIVSAIQSLNEWPNVNEKWLADFHKQLELFYQNT